MNAGARLAKLEALAAVELARRRKAVIFRAFYAGEETPDVGPRASVREFVADYVGGAS